jgi:hypothetical protein
VRLVGVASARSSNDLCWSATARPEIPTRLASSCAAKATPTNSAIPVRLAHSNKAYDSATNRVWLRRRGITPRIARRGVESSTRLGRQRWKVERSLSWLSCFRRLQVRWDRDSGRWFAFVLVACAVICFNRLSARFGTRP